ncbi:MAG: N-6 DNA methylase [Alphaproteobacteria bacterium]|nr:N-6 DNA methylase [Alphaproteobacteria bacterium]MDX5417241.1 N-6 DNA methylase [Alphaproteobacteria bacterium]MDX5494683.1 N-6 DNA methylase [Alphaproteobacteria bacterium]
MNLFNRKTLKRHLHRIPENADHNATLEAWADLIASQRIFGLKETALRGDFTAKIIENVLGYRGPTAGAEYTVAAEQAILRGSVDLALGRFGGKTSDIVAAFELKGAATRDLDAIMPGRNKSPVQQAWEYAMNAPGVKWVLVSNMIELRLYGFGEGTAAYESFRLDRLTQHEEYARFMLLLSAENLLSGRTLELLKESRLEDKDITGKLYDDYSRLRIKLIGAVQSASKGIDPLDAIATAQKILDRVLFVAFAEDTDLLPGNTLADAFNARDRYNPRPVWENFKGLFKAIDLGSEELKIPRYNGGLFQPDAGIDNLDLSDEVCEGFKTLGEYDFASEVSVTVLGHIFEQSISDVERLQAQARGEAAETEKASGTTGRRKRDGVVYTPDYIARFIVAETLGAHLDEIFNGILRAHAKAGTDISDYEKISWRNKKSSEMDAWQAYRDRLKTLRIVDPACGSGVFLIMAFDFLKAELSRVNDKIAELEGMGRHTQDLLDPDSEILANNLFGVDVNEESIEIAKLSLWIKTARRGKVLDSLDGNLRVGDSLIEDSNFAYLKHAFTWETAFPEVFAEGGFDIVLGNPPYVRMEFLKAVKPYLERRYEVVSDRADLYCYFYERGLRLLKPGGRLGYISSNTFFKTGSGGPLREYLLREATIEGAVDFGDLQIFEGVTTYPAILTMKRGPAPEGHELRFWKLDAVPENNFQAAWEAAAGPYPQASLGAGSWELEGSALRALRDKIRKGKKTLKEVYGSPLYGIKTGLNEAFVIDTPAKERLCAEDPRSAELLKPFLEGKDLKRWRAEPRGLWLIYIPKNRIKIDDYPAIRNWLLPFKDRLERRATKQEWFELQQAQEAYAPHFEGKKIIYPHFSQGRKFLADTDGYYANNKCFFVPTSDLHLLALLNSKLQWLILQGLCRAMRGGEWRLELESQYVEQVPMPNWGNSERDALSAASKRATIAARERLVVQTALARRIPDLCPPGREPKLTTRLQEWWTLPDFAAFRAEVKKVFKTDIPLAERTAWEEWIARDRAEIARLSAGIAQCEAEIDRIVYELFELSPDEIALLESAIQT